MGSLDNSTAGREAVFDLVHAMIDDPELESRLPDRAAFIASDAPSFSAFVRDACNEGRPIVVVFPGREYLIVGGKQAADTLVGELHLV
jgi:hypothetical protein